MTDQQTPATLKARQLCLEHAADLIAASDRVIADEGYPNIAYHLGVLALEEIGKAGMISSRAAVGTARDTGWMDKRLDDHIFKLQWAVWSPSLGGKRIDPKEFEEARRFAQSTHTRRLAGLYVDPNANDATAVSPRNSISVDQATSMVKFARARLALESSEGTPVLDEPNEDLKWFLDTMNDEQGTKRLFSKSFIDKHEELKGDARAWIKWAREEFEKVAADEQAHLQRELARLPSAPANSKAKWEMKIRLFTPSHSIRPKVLTYWNKNMGWAKLTAVSGKKNELLLEMKMSDVFTVKDIYDVGLSSSKLCIAALNIGSIGYFWYDLPRQGVRYFESIKDLEAPHMAPDIGKKSGLLGDWQQGALSEKNLKHAIDCIAVFAPLPDEIAGPIFGPYLHGLALLSKTDVHLSFELLARDAFLHTLKNATRHFGDWDGSEESFIGAMHKVFEPIIPEVAHREQLLEILKPPHQSKDGPFEDAISIKRIADLYLVLVSDRIISER